MNNEHDDKRPLSERDKDDGHKQLRKEYKPVIAAYLRARSARCLSIRHAQGRLRPPQRIDKRLDEGDVDPMPTAKMLRVDARTLTAGVLDGSAKRRDASPPNPQLQPIRRPRQLPTISGRQARNYRECVRRSPGRSLSP
jgi:hypothetical protein